MSAIRITTVRGELRLVIAGAEPIMIGQIAIPVEVAPNVDTHGELMLRPAVSVAEVRQFVEQVFHRTPAESGEAS